MPAILYIRQAKTDHMLSIMAYRLVTEPSSRIFKMWASMLEILDEYGFSLFQGFMGRNVVNAYGFRDCGIGNLPFVNV